MPGEYLNSNSIDEYWERLKKIYQDRSTEWKDLTEKEYASIEHSEHTDSDNHFNEERFGKDTNVIDICIYKYLPDRNVAYSIEIKHIDGTKKHVYFQIKLQDKID